MQCSAKVSYEEGVSSSPGSCRTPESFRCFWASLPLLNDLSVENKVYSVLERFDFNSLYIISCHTGCVRLGDHIQSLSGKTVLAGSSHPRLVAFGRTCSVVRFIGYFISTCALLRSVRSETSAMKEVAAACLGQAEVRHDYHLRGKIDQLHPNITTANKK